MRIDLQFFGGRGAKLPFGTGGGGGGKGKNWSKTPNIIENKTLKEAMGKKGRPLSIVNAVKGANPYYKGGYDEYNKNCQRCVIAYEARRRGYDVVAMPTYEGDKMGARAKSKSGKLVDNRYWQGAFRKAKNVNISAKTSNEARKKVESQMKQWGDKSRAIIGVKWKNGGAHVFNVEQVGGKTVYVDAQTGVRYHGKDILSKIKPDAVRLVRTDNLRFSERAKKMIEVKGKRR